MSFSGSATACAGVLVATMVAAVWAGGSADADITADKRRDIGTDDGWTLSVTKTQESLDRWPALDATPTSREGFASLEATADITGNGTKPVNSATVTLGYQVGCQIDVSTGLTLGMGLSFGPNVSVNISYPPSVSVGAQASVTPNIQTTVKPGTIATIPFGSKPLAASHASITADQVEVKVDACLGPVTLRSFATAAMSTATADNSVTVYGDPITL